ncbi:MAG: hypothetical protein AAFP96_10315 [Bacteroidota bacterium]
MKNNKTQKKAKGFIEKTVAKVKDFALNANDIALAKTEEIVTDSLEIAAQWQKVGEKAIKGGLKLSANQQDLVFDILNEVKSDLKEGQKKFRKLVA